jgi:hypothetical protein
MALIQIFKPVSHPVHDLLDFHREEALTCGTGYVKCPSYSFTLHEKLTLVTDIDGL